MKIEPFQLKRKVIDDAFITTSDEGDILHLIFSDGSSAEIGAELMEDEITGDTFCADTLYIDLL